ncbi:tripartite tricarboxylate transporter substrate binding protein [Vineibacter terrae]|uniref:Tripartite tricarboxylate transporter substrate binding protein n=1 Tax=Vineibacter terrae TaxID=2586908 RepID=A0A5C8PN74_9HYPH|nr:tripartite tricarboxylate transporter substrate binding protein [Vineibacter terrae]TXL75937.1 tripartite tricarboxylate transporter substrate binding protein [Vineibacter terrae]
MKITRRRFGALAVLGAASGVAAQPAAGADEFPSRQVRLIVPFAPGGTTDIVGRVLAQQLGEVWGQTVVVENRGGGGTVIGTEALARAPADGYSLMLATPDFTINPSLRRDLPYDPARDFSPVGMVASYPLVLVAHPSVPADSAAAFVALAKTRVGQLSYGSGGSGSSPHLSMELLKAKAGIDLVHVPYRGNGPAITDLLVGRIQVMFTGMPPVAGYVKDGRLKLLGSSGTKRMASAPDLRTIVEQGVPGFNVQTWFGVLAPAGTPQPIIDRVNDGLRQTMAMPKTQAGLAVLDADLTVSSPADFRRTLDTEITVWRDVVRISGARAE